MKRILIQGAMDIETDYLIRQVSSMPDYQCVEEYGMTFYLGTAGGKSYVISRTGMGTVKAGMATVYALNRFSPTLVINQGTAGAQRKNLGTGDVVLVEEAVNINALRMPKKKLGEGSDPFSWEGFHTTYYKADPAVLAVFSKVETTSGRMLKGKAATGDIFSREDDRILWLAEKFHTVCEEMETAAVYEACEQFQTPCAGIRVISNNELTDEAFNAESAEILQEYIWRVVHEYL